MLKIVNRMVDCPFKYFCALYEMYISTEFIFLDRIQTMPI